MPATSDPPITPLPIPPGTPLAIFVGGTFDPVHRAHVDLPLRAREQLENAAACPGRAWLVYIPAARSPHKSTGPVATDAQRIDMLHLALEDAPRTTVWTDEIDRAPSSGGASYTIDTLARARQWLDAHTNAACALRLLMGADQALAFHKWREPHRIFALGKPVVMLRPPITDATSFVNAMRATGAWSDAQIEAWHNSLIDVGVIDAAATSVRSLLQSQQRDPDSLAGILDPKVLTYIRRHALYRPPTSTGA